MSVDDGRLSAATWRPTRTATTASALLAVAVTAALAAPVGAVVPAALGLASGLCLAAAVWTTAVAERRVATLAGSVFATAAGVGLVAGMLAAVVSQVAWPPTLPVPFLASAPFLSVAAGLFAGFGALAAVLGVTATDHAGTAGVRVFFAGLVPAAVLAVVGLEPPLEPTVGLIGAGVDLLLVRRGTGVGTATTPRLGGFLFLTACGLLALRAGLGRAPLVALAADDRREAAATAVGRLRRWFGRTAVVCGLGSVPPILFRRGMTAAYASLPPGVLSALVAVTTSRTVRWLLVAVVAAGGLAAVVPAVARMAASKRFRPWWVPVASLLAGTALALGTLPLHRRIETVALNRADTGAGQQFLAELFGTVGSLAVALGLVSLAVLLSAGLLLSVRIAGALRLVGRQAGVQFAGTGVFVATVAGAIGDLPLAVVVAGVAASLLVWDLGEFAATLGQEVGRHGATRRGELVHVVGGVLLAGLTGAVAVGTGRLLEVVPATQAEPVVVVAAATAGTLLLLLLVR